jgi:hypothetical protein
MSRSGPNTGYAVRRADVGAESEGILRLWLAAYPAMDPAAARRKLVSQYLRAPAGPGICLFLEHGADKVPVGVQCLGLRRFAYGDESILGGIFADYVVDIRHRSLGPALRLMKETQSTGNDALAMLYGFPNEKSEAVCRRVGMRSPGKITRFVRLLRSSSFLARRRGPRRKWLLPVVASMSDALLAMAITAKYLVQARRWHWSEQDDFDGFFDDCWEAAGREGWLIGERSRETLNWRFPKESPRRISIADDRDSGTRQGYIVWSRSHDAVHILDVFCRRPRQQLGGLLAGFANRVRKLGADSISLEFAGPRALEDAVRQAGYLPRDQHPLVLSATAGSGICSLLLESMYLTSFDRDT